MELCVFYCETLAGLIRSDFDAAETSAVLLHLSSKSSWLDGYSYFSRSSGVSSDRDVSTVVCNLAMLLLQDYSAACLQDAEALECGSLELKKQKGEQSDPNNVAENISAVAQD